MTTESQLVDRHGVYKDSRQATGYCWYCPRQDWRYGSPVPDESMWIYCPGCGAATGSSAHLLRGGAAP